MQGGKALERNSSVSEIMEQQEEQPVGFEKTGVLGEQSLCIERGAGCGEFGYLIGQHTQDRCFNGVIGRLPV